MTFQAQAHAEPLADGGGGGATRPTQALQRARFDDVQMARGVLTAVLALSLWIACGSLALAVAEGLGAHPLRRATVGTALVLASAAALWRRQAVCVALQTRPWLVLPLAAAQLTAAAVDGLVGSPYVAFSLTSIGIAAIAARARTVWLCVALLCLGYLGIALLEYAPGDITSDGRLGTALGAVVGYVAAAVPLMLLRGRFTWMTTHTETILNDIRAGGHAFTPALGAAIDQERMGLPAPRPRLTPAERRVVEALAAGSTPKQMAHEWGLSLATIRTHIRRAKHKSGARTLPELAALVSRPTWSEWSHDDEDAI